MKDSSPGFTKKFNVLLYKPKTDTLNISPATSCHLSTGQHNKFFNKDRNKLGILKQIKVNDAAANMHLPKIHQIFRGLL